MQHLQFRRIGIRTGTFLVLVAGQALLAGPNDGAKYLDHGVLRYGDFASEGANLLARMRPVPETLELDARIGGEFIGSRGTRLNVPPDAFVDGTGRSVAGKIQLELIEVIDAFDFATVGVDLTYQGPAGRRFYFQSAGMFHVSARKNGAELRLGRGRTIRVDFPGIETGEFRAYNRSGAGGWVDKGPGPEPEARESINNVEFEENGMFRVGTRSIQIDGLEWWNFDAPYPHVACVKGSVSHPEGVPGKKFHIMAIGIDYKGQFARHIETRTFQINVHKSRQVKIMVVDDLGNIGVSDVIQTPDRDGFDQNPEGPDNFMLDIGTIAVRKVPENVLKDRRAFQAYLGLPTEIYQVKYPDPRRRGNSSP